MTNHLAKTPGPGSIPQGNGVVRDPDKGPVCLDSVPGAHKDLAKSEVLFDVLVEGFDPDALEVKLDHLRFGHLQVVGDKKTDAVFGSGDKQQDGSDLGQRDDKLGHSKPSFLGSSNGFVYPPPLGQAAEGSFLSIHFDDTVSLGGGKKGPSRLPNEIENRGTRIPGIHQYSQWDVEGMNRFGKDFDGDLNFAFESPLWASSFGSIASDRPNQTLRSQFEDTGHSTKSSDETIGPMMNTGTFDLLAVSRTRGVVDNQKRIPRDIRCCDLALILGLKSLDLLGRTCEELVKTVGVLVSKLGGDFADRAKFHKPQQPCEINRQILSLGLAQNSQESRKVRRNLLGCVFAHGFRVLLALAGIGDFDRKPFYLKSVVSLIT